MVTSAAIGGTLQYGYNLAIMNAPTIVREEAWKYLHFTALFPTMTNGQFNLFMQFIQNFINETFQERWGVQLEVYEVTLIWTLIVSIFSLGGFMGALVAGPMSIRFGRYRNFIHIIVSRMNDIVHWMKLSPLMFYPVLLLSRKKTMLVNNVFLLSSSLLALMSRTAKSFEMIIISRILVGINAGRYTFKKLVDICYFLVP